MAAALAIGGIASANHISNTSALPTWNVTPNSLPGSGTGGNSPFQAVQLDVQTHTDYAHPGDMAQGGWAKTVTLFFDDDVRVNLTTIPSCTETFTNSTTIAQAWEDCGPGADTAPEVNAYLSPPSEVSGTVSTASASNFPGCVLVFKKSSTSLMLFVRMTQVFNGPANCYNPAANTSGNFNFILTGNLSTVSAADFKTRLTIPSLDALAEPLDDIKFRLKRAAVFAARCKDTNKVLNLRGTFSYTNPGPSNQPPDTVNKKKACA